MYQKFIPYIVMMALPGCAFIHEDQHQQQQQMQILINKIDLLEAKLAGQFSELQLDVAAQSQQQVEKIQHIEKSLAQFKNETLLFQTESLEQIVALQEAKQTVEFLPVEPVVIAEESLILGEIERIMIEPLQKTFDARLDTGAATSSINALDIEQFERDGKGWVRFYVSKEQDQNGNIISQDMIETPIFRFARIRQSISDEVELRPVVELWVKLGEVHEKVQFTLADRSHMEFPVLIGREFIKDIAIIDVSKKYTQSEMKQAQ